MEDLNINELVKLNINGTEKICGIKRNSNLYSDSNNDNKRISKKHMEQLLVLYGKIDGQKISARQARKIKLKDGCAILQEAFPDNLEFIRQLEEADKQHYNTTQEHGLPNVEGVNCHKNKKFYPNSLSHEELKEIAKIYNINYKGTKKEICKRLNQLGFEFLDDNDNTKPIHKSKMCYKLNKEKCKKNPCKWITETKQILIDRLILLDLLEGNNTDPEDYKNYSVRRLQEQLRNRGILDPHDNTNYMSPTLYSRCQPLKKVHEDTQKKEMLRITKQILRDFKNSNITINELKPNLPNFKSDRISKKRNEFKFNKLRNIYYILHTLNPAAFNQLLNRVRGHVGGSLVANVPPIEYDYNELMRVIDLYEEEHGSISEDAERLFRQEDDAARRQEAEEAARHEAEEAAARRQEAEEARQEAEEARQHKEAEEARQRKEVEEARQRKEAEEARQR